MVSTRRGAHTSRNEDELRLDSAKNTTIRKGTAAPKRATTAATKSTAAKSTGPRTRNNCAKDQNAESSDAIENDTVVVGPKPPKPEPSKATQPTKASAAKSKFTEAGNGAAKAKTDIKKPNNVSRPTRGHPKKDQVLKDKVPELQPPSQPKSTRAARPAVSKPIPLSPKKITQVSRPTSRDTTDKKPARIVLKKDSQKPTTPTTRTASRKQNVSDENKGVPSKLQEPSRETDLSEQSVPRSTPRKTRSTRSNTLSKETRNTSDVSISSTHISPAAQTSNESQGHKEDEDMGEDAMDLNSREGDKDDGIPSDNSYNIEEQANPEDGINGSNPPTKRSRINSGTYRSDCSEQKMLPLQTPARNFVVMRAQNGTPQTQRAVLSYPLGASVDMPMTVSRAEKTAFVFKPLVPQREAQESNSIAAPEIPDDTLVIEDLEAIGLEVEPTTQDTVIVSDDSKYGVSHEPHISEAQFDSQLVNGALEEFGETDSSEWETEYSDSDIDTSSYPDEIDISALQTEMVEPETISWNNVRENVTIPIDFEMHFSQIRALPEATPTERLSINADTIFSAQSDTSETRIGQSNFPDMNTEEAISDDDEEDDEDEDETIHVSEFIVANAMSEPTNEASIAVSLDEDIDVTGLVGEVGSSSAQIHRPDDESIATTLPIQEDVETPRPGRANFDFGIDITGFCESSATTSPEQSTAVCLDQNTEATGMPLHEALQPGQSYWAQSNENEELRETPPPPYELHCSLNLRREDHELSETAIEDVEATPHYARPTFNFDMRRKSLPAFGQRTPIRSDSRPNTSNGSSLPRRSAAWEEPWWLRSRREAREAHTAASNRSIDRPRSCKDRPNASGLATPTKLADTTSSVGTPSTAIFERFPRQQARDNYETHLQTAVPLSRHRTPDARGVKRPATVARLGIGRRLSTADSTPSKRRRIVQDPSTPRNVTPQRKTEERLPRLGSRSNYKEISATIAVPTRFRTPDRLTPVRRAETIQRVAFRNHHSPIRTPLKAPASTSSQELVTPHPAAPLHGLVVLVEVYTNEGASASAPFIQLLHRLGAKTTKTFSDHLTHVIFKNGSPSTLQRIRIHNKESEAKRARKKVECVNSRWVSDCETSGCHIDEADEKYTVDLNELPRGGKRKRKSMEPFALQNVNGNIVRDRNSSYGRNSLGRTSLGRASLRCASFESPLSLISPNKKPRLSVQATPDYDKENLDSLVEGGGSPSTPAWIGAPEKLVQQTAPQNRVRKFKIKGGERENRRLTSWKDARF